MNILQPNEMGECIVCELYMNKAVTMYLKFERGRYCPKKEKSNRTSQIYFSLPFKKSCKRSFQLKIVIKFKLGLDFFFLKVENFEASIDSFCVFLSIFRKSFKQLLLGLDLGNGSSWFL